MDPWLESKDGAVTMVKCLPPPVATRVQFMDLKSHVVSLLLALILATSLSPSSSTSPTPTPPRIFVEEPLIKSNLVLFYQILFNKRVHNSLQHLPCEKSQTDHPVSHGGHLLKVRIAFIFNFIFLSNPNQSLRAK